MVNIIYVLIDPETIEVRYVGMSSRGLTRIKEHLFYGRKYRKHLHKYCWVNSLYSRGKTPIVRILQQWECIDYKDMCRAEKYWISYFRAIGSPLTNLTDGGEGTLGIKVSKETRKKISIANKGRKHTPEAIEKIREASTGREYPNRKKPEFKCGWLDELSEKMKGNSYANGYRHTDEWRSLQAARARGNKYASGFKHAEEWKREASERHKGNKYNLGKLPWNKGNHLEVCKNGHKQTTENTYTYPSGKKKCRVCEKLRMRNKRNPAKK